MCLCWRAYWLRNQVRERERERERERLREKKFFLLYIIFTSFFFFFLLFFFPRIRVYVNLVNDSCLSSLLFFLSSLFSSGVVADTYGRRPTILLFTSILALAGLGSAVAPTFAWLILIRTVAGVGLGGTIPSTNTLMAEVTPGTQNRKQLLFFFYTFYPVFFFFFFLSLIL